MSPRSHVPMSPKSHYNHTKSLNIVITLTQKVLILSLQSELHFILSFPTYPIKPNSSHLQATIHHGREKDCTKT